MNLINQFIKRHALALWIALAVGAVSALPATIAPFLIKDTYKEVQFLALNDEDTYRSRIHEILDGYYSVSSPHLHEYKNLPSLVIPINEYFYALPAFFFSLSVVIVASKFVFPALLFFLVYLLVYKLLGAKEDHDAKMSAIAAGTLVVLGVDLVDYGYILSVIRNGAAGGHLLMWTRLVNPVTGALLLFGFLHFLWDAIISGRRSPPFFAGLMSALSVGYFFNYGMSLAVLAATLIIFFLQKNYVVVKKISIAIIASFVLSIPYWYGIFSSVGGEGGRRIQERNGMFFTHAPEWNKFLIATTCFFVISLAYPYFVKRSKKIILENGITWSFLGALLLGSWIAFNQQVITGREIWIPHFVQYTIPLCFIVVIVTMHLLWREYFPRLWKISVLVMLALSSIPAGMSFASLEPSSLKDFEGIQGYGQALTFLNTQTGRECVVLVTDNNDKLEGLVPAYTHCDLYSTYYNYFGVPDERILHNYLLNLRLHGVTAENVNEYQLAHTEFVRSYFFSNYTQTFTQGKDGWVLERIAWLNDQYKEFLKVGLDTQLHKYRVDYVFSVSALPTDVLRQLPTLVLSQKSGNVYIYTFTAK